MLVCQDLDELIYYQTFMPVGFEAYIMKQKS